MASVVASALGARLGNFLGIVRAARGARNGASCVPRVSPIGAPGHCWAWGAIGHEYISGIAIEQLPDSVPAFVRTPEAAAEIAVMGRELDRSKGAGQTHDKERDPGHYVDLADDGSIMWYRRSTICPRRARTTTRGSGRRSS